MRKYWLSGLLICTLMGYALALPHPAPALAEVRQYGGILRLHVLANSDSPMDQTVKLAVRDAVAPLFEKAGSYADARAFLLAHGGEILSVCEETLCEHGAVYGAQLQLGLTRFPNRVYRDILFPAGEYDALCIVLGSGAGENWWCVLFPPLCIVTRDGAPIDLDDITFESSIWNWIKRSIL